MVHNSKSINVTGLNGRYRRIRRASDKLKGKLKDLFPVYVQEELSSLDNRFVELTSRVNENSQRFES